MSMLLSSATGGGSTVLKDALTGVDLTNVLSEVTGMLPLVIPVMIGFISVRKGLGFLRGILKSA